MKIINNDRLYLGIFLLITGIFLTFAMGLISALFYIGGAALIIYNVFYMAAGITSDKSKIYIPKGVTGIIIGIVMLILPRFIKIGLPVIAGLFFVLAGVSGFFNALEKYSNDIKRRASGILSSIFFVVCGLFIITNPSTISGWVLKLISIGFILLGIGIIASTLSKKKKQDTSQDVIEIDDFNIKD